MRRSTWVMPKVVVASLIGLLVLIASVAAAGGNQGQPSDLHGRALGLFEVEGVVFTDIDEASGRLVVGVDNRGLATAVEKRASALGIPLSEMDVVETKPIVFHTTLRDYVRPLEGGIQIAFQTKSRGVYYICTEGFNATLGSTSGFVTASHCSAKQGVVDGTTYYQPTPAGAIIGTEIADPSFTSCPYVNKKKCRYSDAAFDRRASGIFANLGALAQTTGANNGELTIAGSFTIVSEAVDKNATVGTTLNKVGRTTGWTQGQVTNSCVDVGVQGTNIVLLCQDIVAAGSGGGDSGSPVFRILEEGGTSVQLAGILWGGATDGSNFVYSPIYYVERELGALTTQ